MKLVTRKSILCALCFAILVHNSSGLEERNSDGSTMVFHLRHRYDPQIVGNEIEKSSEEIIKNLAQSDINRYKKIAQRLGHCSSQSCIGKDNGGMDIGQYFVEAWVGTPGQKFFLRADTASDITWFNCIHELGNGGGMQSRTSIDGSKSVFVVHNSTSFQKLLCSNQSKTDSPLFSLTTCRSHLDPCSYEDGSGAKGMFGTDTIAIPLTNGTIDKVQNLVIGCTADGGNLTDNGVLGLGNGNGTFMDKLASRFGGKFSYCLADHLSNENSSSYLAIGDITKPETEFRSPIHRAKLLEVCPYYAVHIVNISNGGKNLSLPAETFNLTANNGVAVIDLGSTVTTLPSPVYEEVINELKKFLDDKYNETAPIPPLEYCFNASGFDENSLPDVVFYLPGGVRFQPPLKNYIIDVNPRVKCIGLLRAPGDFPGIFVIGAKMQKNHLWEFDLVDKTLGFVKSTCA